MIIKELNEYTPEIAARVRELLIQLSRSGKDKGEIPKSWFLDVINSPFHTMFLAYEDDKIIGISSASVVMGPGIQKNAYLEDLVVDREIRAHGVGGALWDATIEWARKSGCKRMEFTCGEGREVAQAFYKKHGAEIYPTNFFRVEL